MAVVVELESGTKIAIDPGVSYAPRRYGLPPHPRELERLGEVKERILREAGDANYIVLTHYHYDHYIYSPEEVEFYRGKVILAKHPSANINFSQRMRAYRLFRKSGVERLAKRIVYIDGSSLNVEGATIEGSEPVPHGPEGSKLGYVVMVRIRGEGVDFVHASDTQGPMSERALNILIGWKPALLFISGPPTYFAGYKVAEEDVESGLRALRLLAQSLSSSTIIVDHHAARDLAYPELLKSVSGLGARITSAADYMGVEYEPLEALRKRLWEASGGN
jgi:hypothetical protein